MYVFLPEVEPLARRLSQLHRSFVNRNFGDCSARSGRVYFRAVTPSTRVER